MSLALVLVTALSAAVEEPPRAGNVIEGVGPMEWGKGRGNTWVNAYALSLQGAGEDVTYDTAMGYSGAAFRLHFHQPDWCPSSPDATVGYTHAEPAAKAFGYSASAHIVDTKDEDAVAAARAQIVASIDAGRPVRAIDLVKIPDWGVIVGYRDSGETLLVRDYHAQGEEYAEAAKFPWIVEFIGERGDAPSPLDNTLRSIEIAIEMATRERYGTYASGFAAYDAWIAGLTDDALYADAETLTHNMRVNAWCYDSLIDARGSAIRYLRAQASTLPHAAAEHVEKAVGAYESMVAGLRAGRGDVVYPWDLKDGQEWTADMRAAAARHLAEAKEDEQKAIGHLREALEAALEDAASDS
ncbi:hypothetical protein HN371_21465 [Candidatus Poribacteria bacterium]|jgi:hypothetical protein|nr:hypothetical protein [Candidatus Poribacteria bacterium]MBT5533865.1 hypothetical protein [Candidatus Poribacteria bacterium]MBT5711615.1 hypothetical protein [Candidatus Poribacteria bacterium]MBT7096969.1 hypothetical protein [Candidatus Poribacteria bacterium]MBT7806058.1 hypothetical protein [Candidatus Poribacteria bacterium]